MRNNKKWIVVIFLILSIALAYSMYWRKSIQISIAEAGEELTFFIASDTHYVAEGLTDGKEAFQKFVKDGDGKMLQYIHPLMDAFAYDIKKEKPEILIISGDLTSNGEKEGHLELAKRLKKIEKGGTSVFVIPGNHDILNPYARGFKGGKQYVVDYINEREFGRIYENFGYREAISRDNASLSYLAAPSEDVWLLMLDTAQYKDNLTLGYPQMDGRISIETMDWIRQCGDLAKAKGAQLIAVMHHNLLDHSDTVREGYTINNNEDVLLLFQQYDIRLALSGHIHIQDIKDYNEEGYQAHDIATGSISAYSQRYGILNYSPKSGFDYNTVNVDVDAWAKQEGIADKDLLKFSEYTKMLYGDRIYERIVSRLAITDSYTTEELKLMGETYKALNLRYYEGEREVGTEAIRNSTGFKLWLSAESEYGQRNVLRLIDANGEKNNKLHINN